jgi:hypothetical protein
MEWNNLEGEDGNHVNAILVGCNSNMRKLLRIFFPFVLGSFLVHQFEGDAGYSGKILAHVSC